MRQAQADAFAAAQDLTRVRNEINALDLQKQGNVVRLEKLSAEKMQLEEERARLEARLHEFAANVESEKLSVETKRGSVEQRQGRLRELQDELQNSSTEQDQFLQSQAEKRSRLTVLEQLEGSREGFDAGAVAALRQSRSVIGSLADRIARVSPVMEEVVEFADRGGYVIGICNGFQILCESHLLPGALMRNSTMEFRCQPTTLRVEAVDTAFTTETHKGQLLRVPVSHGEGNYFADPETLRQLEDEERVVFRYASSEGEINDSANPNGSPTTSPASSTRTATCWA